MAMGVCQSEYLIKSPDFRPFQVMLSHLGKGEPSKTETAHRQATTIRAIYIFVPSQQHDPLIGLGISGTSVTWFPLHVHFVNIIHTQTHTPRYFTKKRNILRGVKLIYDSAIFAAGDSSTKVQDTDTRESFFQYLQPFLRLIRFPTMRTLSFGCIPPRVFFAFLFSAGKQEMFMVFSQVAWSRSDGTRIC
jgi:hypothetical protein